MQHQATELNVLGLFEQAEVLEIIRGALPYRERERERERERDACVVSTYVCIERSRIEEAARRKAEDGARAAPQCVGIVLPRQIDKSELGLIFLGLAQTIWTASISISSSRNVSRTA